VTTPIAPKSFRYEERAAIATITLNRPERKNALTFEVYSELRDTFRRLGDRDSVRAIVITGEGEGFCTGGDVNDIIGVLLKQPTEELLRFTRLTCDLILSLRQCGAPIVAALNGVVAGAGAVIALASDFRVACEEARIAFLFSKVGLTGADMGAAYLLPRVVGMSRATEILMLGEFLPAAEAHRIGLYHRLVPRDRVASEARALAEKLRDGPQFATRMTKKMLEHESSLSLEAALEAEAQAQAICMHNRDYREYFEAFTATPRRKPVFYRAEAPE
jgi:enoyl-CoA hydratase/carnithine racemase